MLHARTVVTPCLLTETRPFARLRGAAASHGVSRRTVGDRALSRGQVSREDMRENYLRVLEKCKCEWPRFHGRGHAVSRRSATSACVCLPPPPPPPAPRRHVRLCRSRSRARRAPRMRPPAIRYIDRTRATLARRACRTLARGLITALRERRRFRRGKFDCEFFLRGRETRLRTRRSGRFTAYRLAGRQAPVSERAPVDMRG